MKTVLQRIASAMRLSPGCFEDLERANLKTTAELVEHVRRRYREFPAETPRQFRADVAYTIYRDLFSRDPREEDPVLYGAWFAALAIASLLIDEHEATAEMERGAA